MIKVKSWISKKVYEYNGINYYEKTYNGQINRPFWGLTYNVLNKLKKDKLSYYVKLVWIGQGGIIINETELKKILKDKALASDGEYKIQYNDLNKYNWDKTIVNYINLIK